MNVNYAKFPKSLLVEQFQGNYLKPADKYNMKSMFLRFIESSTGRYQHTIASEDAILFLVFIRLLRQTWWSTRVPRYRKTFSTI